MGLLFPLSTPGNDSAEILNGICGAPEPNSVFDFAVRFPEACIAFSPLGIKRKKDEEAQKRLAASTKTS